MIQIMLYNSDVDDDFVTLLDKNVNPPAIVQGFDKVRMNSHVTLTAQIQEDGSGYGNVTWDAVRCNDSTVSNTGNDNPPSGGQVDVHAN